MPCDKNKKCQQPIQSLFAQSGIMRDNNTVALINKNAAPKYTWANKRPPHNPREE